MSVIIPSVLLLSVAIICRYAEYRCDECRYAESRGAASRTNIVKQMQMGQLFKKRVASRTNVLKQMQIEQIVKKQKPL